MLFSSEQKEKLLQELAKRGKIKIINLETGHVMEVRSIYEIPPGYVRKGRIYSPEEKEKLSQAAKKRGTPKVAYRNKSGKNNPMYNRHLKYINNGIITIGVPEKQVRSYLLNGWKKGRLKKN